MRSFAKQSSSFLKSLSPGLDQSKRARSFILEPDPSLARRQRSAMLQDIQAHLHQSAQAKARSQESPLCQ